MITSEKNEIINILIEVAKNFNAKSEKYLFSYNYFIQYFKDLAKVEKHHVIIGSSFTYSWMPTILNFSPNNFAEKNSLLDDCAAILNKVKLQKNCAEILKHEELLKLRLFINNSLVGTSKLLHFVDPEKYAIWDSKVFFNLFKETAHKYKLEKPEAYLTYLEFLKGLTLEKNFNVFYEIMCEKCDQITKFRALELAIFKIDKNER